jgi:PilZ domain
MSGNSEWTAQDRDLRQTQVDLAHLERREWWSWGAALIIIAILTAAVAILCVSSVSDQLLTQSQRELVLRGLVPMVLLFAFFTIRQQLQIGRLRRQLATQIAMTATMEVLRAPTQAQQRGWQNRRISARYYFDQRIKVLSGKDTFHGRTRDISETGIGVVIPDSVPTGTLVQLEFAVPGSKEVLLVDAILRHHRGFYNGFEFANVKPGLQHTINGACTGEVVPDVRELSTSTTK